MLLQEWRSDPHEAWFNLVYMMYESSEQFLWQKTIITDQLLGKFPAADVLSRWASGANLKFGIISNRFLGVGTLCGLDSANHSAQIKVLIDPRIVPKPWEIQATICKMIDYAFESGLERVYGYLPLTGSKVMRYWEKVLKELEAKEIIRRVGIEKHAIRTSKRRIGRILFEAVRSK